MHYRFFDDPFDKYLTSDGAGRLVTRGAAGTHRPCLRQDPLAPAAPRRGSTGAHESREGIQATQGMAQAVSDAVDGM